MDCHISKRIFEIKEASVTIKIVIALSLSKMIFINFFVDYDNNIRKKVALEVVLHVVKLFGMSTREN